MGKQRQFSSIFFVLFSMLIGSCGTSHEPTTPQPGSDDNYYREENFIQSSKVVDATQLEIYEGPKYLTSMEGYHISVNDNPLFVYQTRVNHERIFSWNVPSTYAPVVMFDFEGQVHMSVAIDNLEIQSASLSPKVYGVATEVKDNTVTFDLNYSGNYVLTLNNDSTQVIHIFANPLEENPISKEDADKDDSITYIGPGVYKADAIPTKSNSTIYLAGGAYVYGQIRMEGLENVTIRGRGIISGEIYQRRSASEYTIPVEIRSSNNIHMEGITFLDPAGWTIALYKSKDVELNNIKIVSARQNSDGISVQSCENVLVKGGFVRSWDDSLVVKNVDRGSTKNVHFDGVVVWTDLAQSMEVGYETYGPTMDEITFENITVLHNFHKAAISLHNSDDANITNVTYKNITIEDGSMLGDNQNDGLNDFLVDFTIAYNIEWTKSEGVRGTVDGITIDNIKIYSLKDSIVSRIQGESEESKIKNVQISNIEIAKNTVKDKKALNILENSYVENVTYKNTEAVLGAKIELPYQLNLDNSKKDTVTIHPSVEQDGMLVPTFAYSQGELPYIGVTVRKTPITVSGIKVTGFNSYNDIVKGEWILRGAHTYTWDYDEENNTLKGDLIGGTEWMSTMALQNNVEGKRDFYMASQVQITDSTASEYKTGFVPYYVDSNNYVFCWLSMWSGASPTIVITGRLNGKVVGSEWREAQVSYSYFDAINLVEVQIERDSVKVYLNKSFNPNFQTTIDGLNLRNIENSKVGFNLYNTSATFSDIHLMTETRNFRNTEKPTITEQGKRKEEGELNTRISLPIYFASNSAEDILDAIVKVTDPNGNEVELVKNGFTPTIVGNYQVQVTCVDNWGNEADPIEYTILVKDPNQKSSSSGCKSCAKSSTAVFTMMALISVVSIVIFKKKEF